MNKIFTISKFLLKVTLLLIATNIIAYIIDDSFRAFVYDYGMFEVLKVNLILFALIMLIALANILQKCNFYKMIIKNIKDSYCHIPYTFKHYLAFRKVEKNLLGRHVYYHHDWDKLFLFIFFPWLGERIINQFHQRHQKHHPTYTSGKDWTRNLKNPLEVDFLQAVIDWECARITKIDKPLDACDTMRKYYQEYTNFVTPILKELNLYHD